LRASLLFLGILARRSASPTPFPARRIYPAPTITVWRFGRRGDAADVVELHDQLQ
jgi:hypothetical protein